MKISRHFSLGEATRSQLADRAGIRNEPSPSERRNIVLTARHLMDPIRDHFGPIAPSSWFRSLELDSALKIRAINRRRSRAGVAPLSLRALVELRSRLSDSSWSQHIEGCAVDFEVPGVDNKAVVQWIGRSGIEFDQLILENYKPGVPNSGWVHISYRQSPRRQVLTIND